MPAAIDRIIGRAMEKDPAQRYQTLAEFRQALQPLATGGTSIADFGLRLARRFSWI